MEMFVVWKFVKKRLKFIRVVFKYFYESRDENGKNKF